MKDRIQQLRNQANVTETTVEEQTGSVTVALDDESAEMAGYFDNIDDLRRSITVIGQKLDQVRANHHTLLTRPRNDALQAETDQIIQQIKVQALKVNNTIKKMGEDISHMEASQERNHTDVRIKRAQYNTLVKEFRDTMYEYNTITEEYRAKSKERIRRHMQLANRDVTEEQLEDIMDNPDTPIFAQDILVDTAQWQQALSEIQARNQELRVLQTTMQVHTYVWEGHMVTCYCMYIRMCPHTYSCVYI
jgi:syntaxin 1B/2/3